MSEAPIGSELQSESSVSVELPGCHLAAARESRGLSIADVALALKFSERQIAALEQDDYAILQGGTFVRGFIRSYARLLKLDPAPLLKMLDASVDLSQAEIVAPQNMGDAAPASGLPRIVLWILAALVVVASAGAYVWFSGLPESGAPETRLIAAPQTPVSPPVAVSVEKKASAAPALENPGTDNSALNTSSVAPDAPVADSSAEVAPSVAPPVAPAGDGHQLTVDFNEKSWIEIKSGADTLLNGEFPARTHRVVSGRGPFQIWIGNAAGVRLLRDGQAVDLSISTRAGVARLTLD